MKYQDMPDSKTGAGDVLVRVAGIGINPEDMLERNGDTKDRYV
jgi:NADPH:quinone reductase-like Zn-dependent oxidoreductase